MSVQTNYTNEGQLLKQVSCESQLAFLNDSIQSYKKVQMTPAAFFTYLIGEHNKQVSADRQFKVGRVNVTNSTNNVYCYVEDGLNTFDEIDADLLKNESLGGELWIRNEADGVYIDWLRDGVTKGQQQIKINKNMLSVYSKPNLNGLCTVLYPFGATPEESGTSTMDDKAKDVASPRLTIESVNGGKKYLKDSELISKFGRISGSKTWDDVKVAANLKTKGQAYLNTFKAVKIGYELEAVDLQPLRPAVDDFETGKYYQVVNPLEGLNDYLRIIAMSIDINKPLQSGLTIGDKDVKLSQYQIDNRNAMAEQRKLSQQAKIQAKRAYDSRLIGTLVQAISTKDDETSLPLYTLRVAEDNPDFGLKAGQEFAVKTNTQGVDGLIPLVQEEIDKIPDPEIKSNLYGKTLNIIGDSYVANNGQPVEDTWHYKIANKNKMTYRNYGVNGNCLVADGGSGTKVIDRFDDMDNEADYILVVGGKNDYNQQMAISEFSTQLASLIKKVVQKYQGKHVCFFTPWPDQGPATVNPIALHEYADAIEEQCALLGVPCFNSSKYSGIATYNAQFRAKYFQTVDDVSHLNAAGHDLFVNKAQKFLESL